MLLTGRLYLAYFCSQCSKFEEFEINLFKLKKDLELIVRSSCSDEYISVKTYDYKTFYFSVPCIACNTRHVYKYTLSAILKNKRKKFRCRLSNLDILCIGEEKYIEDIVEKSTRDLNEIMAKCGFDEYIENPNLMIKTLDKIHEIAEKGNLYCDCGGREIDINLFSDRIELRCIKCHSVNIIYAENYSDYKNLINKNMIELHKESFTCLDSIYHSGR